MNAYKATFSYSYLNFSFNLFAIFTRVSITGTSVNTPTVVASAAGLDVPNKATATATANSKKFDAQSFQRAAISYGSLIILHTQMPERI